MRRRVEEEKLRGGRKQNGPNETALGGQGLFQERVEDGVELALPAQHGHDDQAREGAVARGEGVSKRGGRCVEGIIQRAPAIEHCGEAFDDQFAGGIAGRPGSHFWSRRGGSIRIFHRKRRRLDEARQPY